VATGSSFLPVQNPPPRPPALESLPKNASACEPHRKWIEEQLRLGRNAMAIYQDLVELFGFTHQYNSVKRFVRRLKKKDPHQYDRLEFPPGEEAQVDYGTGAPTLHDSGKYRRPRLFVMVLKHSGRAFRKVVWKSSKETWCRLHEEAFRYFGGCPQYVTLDNLKEGVIKPDIYDPELNTLYAVMLSHYDVAADPARVRDPNRKGTVENGVKYTQNSAAIMHRLWKKACEEVGIEIKMYDGLKHSGCCQYINERGLSESQLMLITGHVKLETVRKYAKTETSTVRALMETPRLDQLRKKKIVERL
jgi:transposase